MIFHTYGQKDNKAIVLIHGMLTPWQIWNTAIESFKRDYYVIVPELDGHTEITPSEFHSVEEETEKIHKYIMDELGGQVYLLAGLSMGGRIAATLAKNEDLKIENLTMVSIDNVINSVFSDFVVTKYGSDMKILFMHGTKSNESVSRKCAIKMKSVNPQTEIRCFDGFAHAELACFKSEQWVKEVEAFIS